MFDMTNTVAELETVKVATDFVALKCTRTTMNVL